MDRGPEACIVRGSRAHYSCRSVAEIDEHLRGIVAWLRRTMPSLTLERQERIQAQYRIDLDALLDARILLALLPDLDGDVQALGTERPGGRPASGPVTTIRQHLPRTGLGSV